MPKKIDYDAWSKDELIKEIKRIRETVYGLVWHRDLPEEKIDVLINPDARTPNEMFPNEMAGKPFPVLKEVKSKATETDKTKPTNILIEGDNYHSLAVLNFTHQEAIDLIYIDPPYNTGNDDFIYNDKFKSEYVKRDDPFRHSKWLAFTEKRLKLAKNLLKKGGVIFISIDDNEFAQLKLLCDEIFDEKNFITMITVQVNKGGRDYLPIATTHEYILCYFKGEIGELNELPKEVDFELEDKQGKYELRELRNRNPKFNRENRPNLYYPIYVNPDSKDKLGQCLISLKESKVFDTEVFPINSKGEDGCWRWGQKLVTENIKANADLSNVVGKQRRDGGWNIYEKSRKATTKAKSIWDETNVRTEQGTIDLRELGMANAFDHPKPVFLVKKIIQLATQKDSIVLDFMAGSGTTGHAVMALNKEDGGNRQFILCTNNENNICSEVCYPRLKKVIKGYKNPKGEAIAGFGGNLKYYTCDFVEAEPSDRNKRKLVNESTEMLCIKEGKFDLVHEGEDFKIFRNENKYLGIIFDDDAISDYKKAIKKIDGHFNTYVFALGDDPHEIEFEDVKNKVTLCAIPEVILKVYREIFK
ncbi:MAG: site-specific DNA-methyltransferase [Patescibacteria group bacterium]|jgi:adenine-specific DNA-methyltransferase